MKMLKVFFVLFLSVTLLFCNREDELLTPSSLPQIKRKLYYENIDDSSAKKILEYQYDEADKLVKINTFSGGSLKILLLFDTLKYQNNALAAKLNYSSTNSGWELNDSTSYKYENEKLVQEETYFLTSSGDHILIKYKYEGTYLIKKETYNNQKLSNYLTYEYSGDLSIKETLYDDLGTKYSFTTNNFENNLLTSSEVFLANGNLIQLINFSYNEQGYLIIEESKQMDNTITKPLNYVIRIEYL